MGNAQLNGGTLYDAGDVLIRFFVPLEQKAFAEHEKYIWSRAWESRKALKGGNMNWAANMQLSGAMLGHSVAISWDV